MANTLTMARANSALKVLFPQKRIEMMDWENLAFYNWVTRDKGFYGRSCELPVRIGPSGNASNNFAAAQSMKGSSNYTHFLMTRVKKYIMASFDNEALEASENDAGAYMAFKELEIEGIIQGIKQQTAADFQGNGSGRIATVTVVNGNVLTVGESDIVHFQLDQRIQSFAVNAAGAVPTSAGPKGWMTVGSIDPDNNTITLNTTDGDTALQDGVDATTDKYLAIYGSVGNALSGTHAWVPADRSVLATPFKGVTRSLFTSRLGGVYYDGSANGSIAEALERAIARGKKEGSTPEVAWLNHNRFQDVSLDLGARAVREPFKIGQFAYDSISFAAGGKSIKLLADPNFNDNDCLIATKASWRFHTLKDAPRALGRQGNGDMILEPAADGWEVRYGWYGELECLAPIDNIRVVLPV
jgi:hypothetical protein